jgi:hypothetical protein
VTSRDLMATQIETGHVVDFRARTTRLTLGEAALSMLEFPALRSTRTRS